MNIIGMGTKVEYAINPLGNSQNRKRFTVHGVDDWDCLQNSGVKRKYYSSTTGLDRGIQDSMDGNRMLDKYNIDSIKQTMQMHEDIFKHQVQELHRLYSVQKLLMDELKKEIKQSRIWGPMTNSDISTSRLIHWQQPSTGLGPAANFQIQSLRDDLNSRECSGCCSGDTMRISRGFDLERPAEEDISTGVSTIDEDQHGGRRSNVALKSNKMRADGPGENSDDVELTLSIGSSASKKGSKTNNVKDTKELDSSASFKSDREGECSDPSTPMSSSSATFDQERKQPHWLFHSLKLK